MNRRDRKRVSDACESLHLRTSLHACRALKWGAENYDSRVAMRVDLAVRFSLFYDRDPSSPWYPLGEWRDERIMAILLFAEAEGDFNDV